MSPIYHASLAEVHRALGQLEEAVARGCEAIRLGLDDPAARNNLGLALHAPGAIRRGGRRVPERAGIATRRRDGPHQSGRRVARTGRARPGTRTHEPGRRARPPVCLRAEQPRTIPARIRPSRPSAAPLPGRRRLAARDGGGSQQPRQCLSRLGPFRRGPVVLRRGGPEEPGDVSGLRQPGTDIAARRALGRGFALAPPRDRAPARTLSTTSPSWPKPRSTASTLPRRSIAIKRSSSATPATRPPTTHWAGSCRRKASSISRPSISGRRCDLQPDLAVAHVTLGSLHEKMGDFAAAEACFRTAIDDDAARSHALARLAMLLRGKLPDDDCKAIEDDGSLTRTRPTRPGSTFSSAWRTSGMRAGVMPKRPPARARPTPSRWPSFSGETWCTIRPSTSGSSRG